MGLECFCWTSNILTFQFYYFNHQVVYAQIFKSLIGKTWLEAHNEGEFFDYIPVGTSIMAEVILKSHHQNVKLLLCPYELCY
jgi:hypothetical protein